MAHNPVRQVEFLQQALAQDKRPIGLLIGAGCPFSIRSEGEPLIPDIAGITTAISETLKDNSTFAAVLQLLEKGGFEAPNVEQILTEVRLLQQVVGDGELGGITRQGLDDVEKAITESVYTVTNVALTGADTPYHHLAAWAGSIPRAFPVEIFTTNYDLLMEEALESLKVPYFDGFVGARRAFLDVRTIEDDVLPPRWARLWKLHGSISWYYSQGELSRTAGAAPGANRIIHPSHLKYEQSRRMPYLVMTDRLRAFLRRPSALTVVVGYSFRDEHVNEVLLEGLESNPGAMCVGLMYGNLDSYTEALEVAAIRPNLNLLASDGAVIGTMRSSWENGIAIPDALSSCIGVEGDECHLDLGDFVKFGRLLQGEVVAVVAPAHGDAAGAELVGADV